MKKILPLAFLSLAAAGFTGCTEKVGVDNPDDTVGYWYHFGSGTLDVRYIGKTLDQVFQAAIRGVDQYGAKRVGEDRPVPGKSDQNYYRIYARTDGDIKLTVQLTPRRNPENKTEWIEVSVQFGSFGNLQESQRVVSFISKNI